MNVESVKIEYEEDGMWMVLQLDEEIPLVTDEGRMRVRIQNVAEEVYDTVRGAIGPWLRERDEARYRYAAAFHCNPDESGGYDTSDPKHPEYHSIHADLYDSREGK